jgi:hypothetical protein
MTTNPSSLADRVGRRCEQVIGSEVARLGRRQPRLTPAELAVVEQALSELADKLLLDAIRHNPDLSARVEPLFSRRR